MIVTEPPGFHYQFIILSSNLHEYTKFECPVPKFNQITTVLNLQDLIAAEQTNKDF